MKNKNKLEQIIRQSVHRVLTENQNERKQMENQLAQEILGTPTFEDFYKNTGLMVGPRDYYLMSEYFKRLAELRQQ